jgi:hypothetical protein
MPLSVNDSSAVSSTVTMDTIKTAPKFQSAKTSEANNSANITSAKATQATARSSHLSAVTAYHLNPTNANKAAVEAAFTAYQSAITAEHNAELARIDAAEAVFIALGG